MCELAIPDGMTGVPLETVITGWRKLLVRYAPDSEKLFPVSTPVPKPAPIVTSPPVAAATVPPTTRAPSSQELEEEAALDKQIQANENLINTTSCVIQGYGDGNKFNSNLTNLAKSLRPEVSIKVLYVNPDEMTQYLVSLYPNKPYNELLVFVVRDLIILLVSVKMYQY